MPLKRLVLYRGAVLAAATLLSACSTFMPESGQPTAGSDTVTLGCYWRFRLSAIDECHVSSVDGQRPAVSQFANLKTELAPGHHWIEIRIQHTVGFGGTMDVCAFEHDFLAGHHYRILPRSFSVDGQRPWRFAKPLYTASVDLEETAPDAKATVHRPALTCSTGGSLCRTTSDCAHHPDAVCLPQPGHVYGKCGFKR